MKPSFLEDQATCRHGVQVRQAVVGKVGSLLIICLDCGEVAEAGHRERIEVPSREDLIAHARGM